MRVGADAVDAHARNYNGVTGTCPSAASPSDRSAADRRLRRRARCPWSCGRWRASSISAASSSSRATSSSPEQVAELAVEAARLGAGAAGLGERRSGGRPRRAPARRRSPSGRRWRRSAGAATWRWPSGSRGRWPPSCGPSASRSTTRRCSTSTPIRRIRSSAIARWPSDADDVARLGAAIVRGAAGGRRRRLRQALSGHGDTSADSHLELPLVEHPPERLRDVEFAAVPGGDRGRRRHAS